MEEMVADSISQQRFTMLLLAAFAGLALLLAAAGIYSVLSYSVRRRVREIGIRMALGAQISDVLRLVIVEGMKPALLGLAIGLAGALALGRVLSKLIYGVSPADPATFAAVSALLAAVALAASIIPAARATRVEPVKTLREE
jgi:putative ABC transport system permease protein